LGDERLGFDGVSKYGVNVCYVCRDDNRVLDFSEGHYIFIKI